MGKLEGIAVVAIIRALEKIGETFLDGDRKDDLKDVVNALLGVFGLDSGEEKTEERESANE